MKTVVLEFVGVTSERYGRYIEYRILHVVKGHLKIELLGEWREF